MKKIIITAESGSDITVQEAAQYGIELVPMHVTMGDETFDDGTFPAENICRFYDEHRKLPKTSGSSPSDFMQMFDRIHEEHPEAQILHMAYSAVTTVSYGSARIAAEERDYVTIIDTKHVSAGQRAAVLRTAKFLAENPDITVEELAKRALEICEQTKMCFIPADLTYLHAGGRCGNLAFVGGQLLKLHPCIDIQDGKLIAARKYRGSFRKVVPELIRNYVEQYHLNKEYICFIWSVGLNEEIRALAEQTARECGFSSIEWVQTGCVITTHAGPSAFGIVGTV